MDNKDFRHPSPDTILAHTETDRQTLRTQYALQMFEASADGRAPTPEEAQAIEDTIHATAAILASYGIVPRLLPSLKITLKNPGSETHPLQSSNESLHAQIDQLGNITIFALPNHISDLISSLVHELVHWHSFRSVEYFNETIGDLTVTSASHRRIGMVFFDTRTSQNEQPFYYLDEALTEELSLMILAQLHELIPEVPHDIATDRQRYQAERESLHTFMNHLRTHAHVPSVESLLYTSFFNGHIKDLARIIENTYGKGAFRELGMRFGKRPIIIDDILKRAETTENNADTE